MRLIFSWHLILFGSVWLCSGSSGASEITNPPTIELSKPVHFTAPAGADVVVGPGTFEIEAGNESLRLKPKEGKAEDGKEIEAHTVTHAETLRTPKAVEVAVGEDILRVVLLLPDGKGLLAEGSYSCVSSRGSLYDQSSYTVTYATPTQVYCNLAAPLEWPANTAPPEGSRSTYNFNWSGSGTLSCPTKWQHTFCGVTGVRLQAKDAGTNRWCKAVPSNTDGKSKCQWTLSTRGAADSAIGCMFTCF